MSGERFSEIMWRMDEMDGKWEDAELNALFHDLFCGGDFSPRDYGGLAQSLNYYLSSDTDEESYRKDVAAFKRKWFHRTPRTRVEFYQRQIQEYADRCKREMGEA